MLDSIHWHTHTQKHGISSCEAAIGQTHTASRFHSSTRTTNTATRGPCIWICSSQDGLKLVTDYFMVTWWSNWHRRHVISVFDIFTPTSVQHIHGWSQQLPVWLLKSLNLTQFKNLKEIIKKFSITNFYFAISVLLKDKPGMGGWAGIWFHWATMHMNMLSHNQQTSQRSTQNSIWLIVVAEFLIEIMKSQFTIQSIKGVQIFTVVQVPPCDHHL